jgi:hypothetical protein
MNRSEKIVYRLCKQSFLSLWSHAIPKLQNGKEFCDVLLVFGNQIIIFSVKEIQFGNRAEDTVASKRWRREAVEKSVKQIYNAERWVTRGMAVFSDQNKLITMPDPKNLRIQRVAVALGSKGMVSIESRDFGKGFVHVYDEQSTYLLLRELNTVTDFLGYLNAVESFLSTVSKGIIIHGGDEDLLAFYLLNNRSFPKKVNALIIGNDIWDGFNKRPEVKRRRKEDKISYLWDGLIETLAIHEKNGTWEYTLEGRQAELALRVMATENRYSRRILGQNIDDILRTTPKGANRGRLVQSPSGVVYVLLVTRKDRNRDERRAELWNRCLVARDIVHGSNVVVGIATENYDSNDPGFSFDVCYVNFEDWTAKQHKQAKEIREKFGWFPQDTRRQIQVDEYPEKEE